MLRDAYARARSAFMLPSVLAARCMPRCCYSRAARLPAAAKRMQDATRADI